MPETILCDCPHCGNTLSIDPASVGEWSRCPSCRKDVHLPDLLAGESTDAARETPEPAPIPAGLAWAGSYPSHAHYSPEVSAEPEPETEPAQGEPEGFEYEPKAEWAPVSDTWEAPEEAPAPLDESRIQQVEWTQESEEPETFTDELADESENEQDPETGPDPGIRRKRRKRRFGLFGETPDWETSDPRRRGRDTIGKRIITAGVAIAALGAIVAGVIMFSSSGRTGGEAKPQGEAYSPIVLPTDGQEALAPGEAMKKLQEALQLRPRETVATIIPTVESFLKAANWQERAGFVRDPERVRPLMEKYYNSKADGPIPYLRLGEEEDRVDYRGNLLVLRVLFEDYSTKQVAIEYTGAGFLIDWESFVGYGEMPIEQYREQRPATPVLMRASFSPAVPPYFNYAFTDEENLECYVLSFPDESYLFGYTMKIGSIANRLRELRGEAPSAMAVLKLRYPENAKVGDQVWIDEIVAEGWILHEVTRTTEP